MGLGLKKFAYVGESTRRYSARRYEGFSQALHESGRECTEIDIPISQILKDDKWSVLHTQLNEALSALELPVGLLTRDDIVAMNVLRSARALGIKVPDELALVGINDSEPYCHIASPKLTSVKHPGILIGYYAARVLDEQMRGETVQDITRLTSPGITERESSNTIAIRDELVSQTLAYIRQNAKGSRINVADICRKLAVSSTTLRLRFKDMIGHSVKEEIDRVRHLEVCDMLNQTQTSIQEIAYHMDFNSPEELTRFFTRKQGESPTKYRERFR